MSRTSNPQRVRVLAFLVMGLAGTIGFLRIERANDRIEATQRQIEVVRKESDLQLCQGLNENREKLRSLLIRSGESTIPVDKLPPELAQLVRDSMERGRKFREAALADLPLKSCVEVVP